MNLTPEQLAAKLKKADAKALDLRIQLKYVSDQFAESYANACDLEDKLKALEEQAPVAYWDGCYNDPRFTTDASKLGKAAIPLFTRKEFP